MVKISSNKFILLFFLFISNLILSVKGELDEDTYLKALSCVSVITERHKLGIQENEEPSIYSPTMLSCFIKISPDKAQEILTNLQDGSISLEPEEILELTDTQALGQYSEEELSIKSKLLENAINEFQKMEEDKDKFSLNNLLQKATEDKKDNNNKDFFGWINHLIEKVFITRSTSNFWIALAIIIGLMCTLAYIKNEEEYRKDENSDIQKKQNEKKEQKEKEKEIDKDKEKAE